MMLRIGLIMFCAILYVGASDRGPSEGEGTVNRPPVNGMLELLVAKLEAIEYRLQKMESMQLQLQKIEDNVDNVHSMTRQIMDALPQLQLLTNIREKQEFVTSTADYSGVVASTEVSVSTTTTTTPKSTTTTTATTPEPKKTVEGSRCKDIASNVSGIYPIRVKNDSEPFQVYCEQQAFGGGWIVFQFRYDGSLDFYRGWDEFRDGFGDLNKEFWLGLEKVHQITKGRTHELIVELKDFSGTYKYVRYRAFEIGSESEQYALKDLQMYKGTARNEMAENKGMKFSTKDRDNDVYTSRHCAQFHESAWWHSACTYANLNGRYMDAVDYTAMFWWDFNTNRQGLSYSRMMIREVE